jgi:hypothetical protein
MTDFNKAGGGEDRGGADFLTQGRNIEAAVSAEAGPEDDSVCHGYRSRVARAKVDSDEAFRIYEVLSTEQKRGATGYARRQNYLLAIDRHTREMEEATTAGHAPRHCPRNAYKLVLI